MLVEECYANISKKKKFKKCSSNFIRLFTNSHRSNFTYSSLGIMKHIELGGKWLQHYSSQFLGSYG